MVALHVNLQGQVYAKASDMVLLVEQYLLYTKGVKVRIKPLMDQEDIRKLGIAYDHACKYFGLINPFYNGLPSRDNDGFFMKSSFYEFNDQA